MVQLPGSDQFAAQRQAMVVSQLRPNAVTDAGVLDAMGMVARERFLPPALTPVAYIDAALPLGGGRVANPPIATGRLLTMAAPRAGERALVVGAAGGYAAALLAAIGVKVVALESDAALVALARAALGDQAEITLVEAPLAEGHAAGAPYDLIYIDGAVEDVPPALVDQLAVGGRLASGIVDRGVTRLCLGRRTAGGFGLNDFADLEAAVLPGFARPKAFTF